MSAAGGSVTVMSDTAELVVEIHVPLTPDTNAAEGETRFPWIETLVEFTTELDEGGEIFVVEEGDVFNDAYVIVITGADEATLTGIAIGVWIDETWPSQVSWTVTMLFVGVTIGCANAWYWLTRKSLL